MKKLQKQLGRASFDSRLPLFTHFLSHLSERSRFGTVHATHSLQLFHTFRNIHDLCAINFDIITAMSEEFDSKSDNGINISVTTSSQGGYMLACQGALAKLHVYNS